MPTACGPGTDYVAGPDPDGDKRALEAAPLRPGCSRALYRRPRVPAVTVWWYHIGCLGGRNPQRRRYPQAEG